MATYDVDKSIESKVLQQFRETDIVGFIQAYKSQFQDVHNLIEWFKLNYDLDNAQGLWLDLWGKLFGIERDYENEDWENLFRFQIDDEVHPSANNGFGSEFVTNFGSYSENTATIDGVEYLVYDILASTEIYTNAYKKDSHDTWEFHFCKGTSTDSRIIDIITNDKSAAAGTADGYSLFIDGDGTLNLARRDLGAPTYLFSTASGYVPQGEWVKFTFVRKQTDEISLYMNDILVEAVSGINPVTQWLHQYTDYFVAYLRPDDRLQYNLAGGRLSGADGVISSTRELINDGAYRRLIKSKALALFGGCALKDVWNVIKNAYDINTELTIVDNKKISGLLAPGNLLTNGEFTTDISDWTTETIGSASVTWLSGALRLQTNNIIASCRAYQQINVNGIGGEYVVIVNVKSTSTAYSFIRVGLSPYDQSILSYQIDVSHSSTAVYVASFKIPEGTESIYVTFYRGELGYTEIDSISLFKEIDATELNTLEKTVPKLAGGTVTLKWLPDY